MAINRNKTHHININTSSNDSVSLSFFHLNKNYGLREYDTFNKVSPNPQLKQSNDKVCIESISNSVTLVQDGRSVEVCCLYCNKIYKLGADLTIPVLIPDEEKKLT